MAVIGCTGVGTLGTSKAGTDFYRMAFKNTENYQKYSFLYNYNYTSTATRTPSRQDCLSSPGTYGSSIFDTFSPSVIFVSVNASLYTFCAIVANHDSYLDGVEGKCVRNYIIKGGPYKTSLN